MLPKKKNNTTNIYMAEPATTKPSLSAQESEALSLLYKTAARKPFRVPVLQGSVASIKAGSLDSDAASPPAS